MMMARQAIAWAGGTTSGDEGNGVFKAIENWASQSDERARLLVMLIWAAFGLAVAVSTVVLAVLLLPDEFWAK